MKSRTYATEAVILGRRNFGEADRILTVFSKHYGKLFVIAKGVRKPTSRKKSSLELFNYVKLFLAKGKNLDIVTEVEVKESFQDWRKDLVRVGVAYHLAEVTTRFSSEQQEHRDNFELLINSFRALSELDYWQLYPLIQSFKVNILENLGFLERKDSLPKNLDFFIEDLLNGELKTKRFLNVLK